MLLLPFLAYRVEYSVDQSSPSLSLPSYAFQAGGEFSISFDHAAADAIFVGVCNEPEFKSLSGISNLDDALCLNETNRIEIATIVEIWDSSGSFRALVQHNGIYRAVLYTCGQQFSKFDVVASFRNPDSFLSADIQPCLYIKPVAIGIFGFLFVSWMANWFWHFTLRNALHAALTVAFFLNVVNVIVSELELKHKDQTDDSTVLTEIRYSLSTVYNVVLIGVLLLAARGWCIILDAVGCGYVSSSFCYSAFAVLPIGIVDLVAEGVVSRVCCVIAVVAIALYCQRMAAGVSRAWSMVIGHLLVISRNGIDGTTTPIYRKFRIFKFLIVTILVYLSIVSVCLVVQEFVTPGFWIVEVVTTTNSLFITVSTMWSFRLTFARSTDYMMMPPGGDLKQSELLRCELEGLGPESEELRGERVPYRDGMPLPQQPVFLDDGRQGARRARAARVGCDALDADADAGGDLGVFL
jgi:hypothetical protein